MTLTTNLINKVELAASSRADVLNRKERKLVKNLNAKIQYYEARNDFKKSLKLQQSRDEIERIAASRGAARIQFARVLGASSTNSEDFKVLQELLSQLETVEQATLTRTPSTINLIQSVPDKASSLQSSVMNVPSMSAQRQAQRQAQSRVLIQLAHMLGSSSTAGDFAYLNELRQTAMKADSKLVINQESEVDEAKNRWYGVDSQVYGLPKEKTMHSRRTKNIFECCLANH
mmetsp:Transcript_53264/g.72755  ORF Transcript_53264/g.72755 Transcript_53264/m.72755 type:complete len:231 (-) Transcript_53264:403-1095(-)